MGKIVLTVVTDFKCNKGLWHLGSYEFQSVAAVSCKLLGGYVNRVTDWCVTGRRFAPRRVQL